MLNYLNERLISVEGLEAEVIQILIDEVECNECFMEELLCYGCQSGIVSSLVTYNQTEEFFTRHMNEIFALYNNYITDFEEFKLDVNANNLAWLAFEIIADNIYYDYQAISEEA